MAYPAAADGGGRQADGAIRAVSGAPLTLSSNTSIGDVGAIQAYSAKYACISSLPRYWISWILVCSDGSEGLSVSSQLPRLNNLTVAYAKLLIYCRIRSRVWECNIPTI